MRRLLIIAAVLSAFAAGRAAGQVNALASATQAGQVGEKSDGYLGVVGTPSPELRRQVAAVNLRRRNLYIELSTRREVSPQLVGMATACELLAQIPVGGAYQLSDGVWRRRAPGESVPLPDYCR